MMRFLVFSSRFLIIFLRISFRYSRAQCNLNAGALLNDESIQKSFGSDVIFICITGLEPLVNVFGCLLNYAILLLFQNYIYIMPCQK